jgi:glycosyltransferase involved in cell wall biosynthesis
MRVLLLTEKDHFQKYDYSIDSAAGLRSMGGNSGNNIFQFSLQSLLSNKSNDLIVNTEILKEGFNKNETYYEYLNSNFDSVVFSPANALANYAKETILKRWVDNLKPIKIPIIAVGLGAQSDASYTYDFLSNIKDEARIFIDMILISGGKIGTRGEFTSSCLDKLGYKNDADFSTIGCPSMFLGGNMLNITNSKVEADRFNPALNGFRFWNTPDNHAVFHKYPKSIFVCQEEFYKLLYEAKNLTAKELQYLSDCDHKFLKLYRKDRVKLYCDFSEWSYDLKERGINFSYGCRIHGNVAALLNDIPAVVDPFDSRVKELAEYFNIPTCNDIKKSVYEKYLDADFTDFNASFGARFDQFESFMKKVGLHIEGKEHRFDDFLPYKNIKSGLSYLEKQSNIAIKNKLTFNINTKISKKNVVFVAHEFGLYRGHGGIASYLYNICKYLIEETNFNITVLSSVGDQSCSLLKSKKFTYKKIKKGNLKKQRASVLSIVESIRPDYLEIADFNALGLDCVIGKKNGNERLQNTVIITNNHTANRECYEWSCSQDLLFSDKHLVAVCQEERMQMLLSDHCIAPSSFLAKYLKRNYSLSTDVLVFANPYLNKAKKQDEFVQDLKDIYDLDFYSDSFNITLITRFEGRKRQERLIKATVDLLNQGESVNLFLCGSSSPLPISGKDCRLEVFKCIEEKFTDRIQFFDFLNRSEQQKFLAISNLVVLPSTFENQPMAMIESVMAGVPVIASKYSGIADYSPSELLFDPFKEDDLKIVIHNFITLCKKDKDKLINDQLENLLIFINPEISILPRFNIRSNACEISGDLDLKNRLYDT